MGREDERDKQRRQPSSQRLKEFLCLVEDVRSVILSVERVLPFSNDEHGRSKITLPELVQQDSLPSPWSPGYFEFPADGPVIHM